MEMRCSLVEHTFCPAVECQVVFLVPTQCRRTPKQPDSVDVSSGVCWLLHFIWCLVCSFLFIPDSFQMYSFLFLNMSGMIFI